jgi:ADP-heptose:LPS heptosyltransferase
MVTNQKILVLCPIGLGNYIMLLPALDLLAEKVGKENVDLLALKLGILSMAKENDRVANVFCWEPSKTTLGQGLRLILELRKKKYLYTVNAFPTSSLGFCIFSLLTGAKNRIGFDYPSSPNRRKFLTKSYPVDLILHDVDQNLRLVEEEFGAKDPVLHSPRCPWDVSPSVAAGAQSDYFVCHPGSSAERGMKDKRLPPEKFAQVILHIYETFGIKCVLVGGPEEADLRSEVTAGCQQAIAEISTRSLKNVAEVIAASQFFLGNDSGLMHVAASTGKRCIVFFGPTDDRRNGPYSEPLKLGEPNEHLILRRRDLPCSPCWTAKTVGKNPPCIFGDTRCIQKFPIEEFLPEIDSYLRDILNFRSQETGSL